MSGICGIVALDGSEPQAAHIEALIAPLERRGPDGSHSWLSGPGALGHTLLATTPEALVEVLPLTDPESGCTITADARLDNREELFAAFGLAGETRTIGDGELILRSYLHWGEDCPSHLLGDFAFAIWDPRAQQLFCARDHMGMRQLIYHYSPGRLFAFSSEPEGVLAHEGVPRRINEGRIADFLDDLEGLDLTSTFFEGVLRLAPAHTLMVAERGLSIRRYWELRPERELKLNTDEDYAQAFMKVFTEAVRCRLRSTRRLGSMLSGGLDSSSVAAVAARLLAAEDAGPLPTISAIGPDPSTCVETRSVQSVLSTPGLAGTTVSYDDLDEYREVLANSVETVADPFDGQMNLVRAVYLAANQKGINVVLDGVGGDLALTGGNRIAQFMRRLRIDLAISEARSEARFWGCGERPSKLLLAGAWAGLVPQQVRRYRHRLIWRKEDRAAMAGRARLTKEFASKIEFDHRRRRYRRHLAGVSPTGKDYQLRTISDPHTAAARERYDRIASAFAIEPRDPFLDLRLVRFCLSLPPAQLRSDGWTKVVLRRAMTGILPDDVAWRLGKDHLGGRFAQALIEQTETWADQWKKIALRLKGICSSMALGDDPKIRPSAETETKNFIELFSLGCWLVRNDVRND